MITLQELRRTYYYCPFTGNFFVINPRFNIPGGYQVGHKTTHGYIGLGYKRKHYYAHRLAWLYVNGEWPSEQIDHINLNRGDNRICNLREATRVQNNTNKDISPLNTSGHKGVHWDKTSKRWISQITVNGKKKHLGSFTDINEAAKSYNDKAKKYFGEFYRT